MKKTKLQKENINLALNIGAILIALLSIYLALQANRKSEKANQIAEEANQIAKEANAISVLSLSADVQLLVTDWADGIYNCINPLTGNRLVYVWKPAQVLITNSGGALTSLVEVEGKYPSDSPWIILAYNDSDFSSPLELPIDVPPGSSRKLYFVAIDIIGSGKTPDEAISNSLAPYGGDEKLSWNFVFGNGQSVGSIDPFLGYSPGYNLPEECVYYNQFSP